MMHFLGALGRRRAAAAPVESKPRSSHRYPAVANDARLGWWAGDEFHEVAARLDDISQGGAALAAGELPPDPHVFLRLVRPAATGWIAALAVWAKVVPEVGLRLGVEFPEGCPYDLFKEARGCRLDGWTPAELPSHLDDRQWR